VDSTVSIYWYDLRGRLPMVGTTVDGIIELVGSATSPAVGVATGRWTVDGILELVGSATAAPVGVASKNKYDMYFIVTFLIVKKRTYLRLRISPWTRSTHLASQIVGVPLYLSHYF